MRGCGRRHAASAAGKARCCRVVHETPRDGLRREMEHTGQRTRGARPSTELSEWTIDRVRRRRLSASAHHPATTASASDDQQLRPAAPTSTSTIQPPHTSLLTSQFRLERPQCVRCGVGKVVPADRLHERASADFGHGHGSNATVHASAMPAMTNGRIKGYGEVGGSGGYGDGPRVRAAGSGAGAAAA